MGDTDKTVQDALKKIKEKNGQTKASQHTPLFSFGSKNQPATTTVSAATTSPSPNNTAKHTKSSINRKNSSTWNLFNGPKPKTSTKKPPPPPSFLQQTKTAVKNVADAFTGATTAAVEATAAAVNSTTGALNGAKTAVVEVVSPNSIPMEIDLKWDQGQDFWTVVIRNVPISCFNMAERPEDQRGRLISFETMFTPEIEDLIEHLRVESRMHQDKIQPVEFNYEFTLVNKQKLTGPVANSEFSIETIETLFKKERAHKVWKMSLSAALDKNLKPHIKNDPVLALLWNDLSQGLLKDFEITSDLAAITAATERLKEAYLQLLNLSAVAKVYDPAFITPDRSCNYQNAASKLQDVVLDWSIAMTHFKYRDGDQRPKTVLDLSKALKKGVEASAIVRPLNVENPGSFKIAIETALFQYRSHNSLRPWHFVSPARFYTVGKLLKNIKTPNTPDHFYNVLVQAIAEVEVEHESHFTGHYFHTKSRLAKNLRDAFSQALKVKSAPQDKDLDEFTADIIFAKTRLAQKLNKNKTQNFTDQFIKEFNLEANADSCLHGRSISARASSWLRAKVDSMRRVRRG